MLLFKEYLTIVKRIHAAATNTTRVSMYLVCRVMAIFFAFVCHFVRACLRTPSLSANCSWACFSACEWFSIILQMFCFLPLALMLQV
jgi:hypothetical protein